MSEILGLSNLIVNSEIVIIKNGNDEKVGVLMDEAEGIGFPELKSKKFIRISPYFQKEMNDLQILDTIVMQMDRYKLNYNIKISEYNTAIGVAGYDNDCSFNLNTDLTRSLGHVPQIIRETLFGMLDNEYIQATIERFLQIKNAIKATLVDRPGFLLEDWEWSESTMMDEINYNDAIPKDKFKNDDRIFHHELTYFGAFIEELKENQYLYL